MARIRRISFAAIWSFNNSLVVALVHVNKCTRADKSIATDFTTAIIIMFV